MNAAASERAVKPSRADALLQRRLQAGARRPGAGANIPRRPASQPAVLSFAQQRLWLLDQIQPGTPLYNVPVALRFSGPLEVRILEKAFGEILARHEALRTCISTVDGEPVHQAITPRPFRLTLVDLQSQAGAELEQELKWRLTAEAQRPFDLRRDLMLRATIFRLGLNEHVLLITMHHIASDAWSIEVLLNELACLYNAHLKGDPSPLPPLPIQYSDFASWQRDVLSGSQAECQLRYWREKLANLPPSLDLPTKCAPGLSTSHQGATRSIVISHTLLAGLQRLSQREGVTLFMVLLSAFKTLLHRYSGETDLVIGSPVAGRRQLGTEPLIGFFLNTLVLRTDLSGDPTFLELIRRVRDASLEAFANGDVPFEKLVQELQPERQGYRTPFFQAMFTLQAASTFPKFERLHAEPVEVDLKVSPFDLTLFTEETTAGLTAAIEYKSELFEPEIIEHFLEAYRVLLEAIVAEPERRLSQVSLVAPAREQQIISAWSLVSDVSNDCPVHDLIARQAARAPDACAVTFGERRITYADLNARADALAAEIMARGCSRGSVIAICAERSIEAVVGLVAILKAGCAYLPLDPSEPADRRAFKIKDAGAGLVLAQQSLQRQVEEASPKPILYLDQERGSQSASLPAVALSDTAYIIYTSGSTGAPKGVAIEHRALAAHATGFSSHFGLRPEDRILQFAPLIFDVSVEEIFPALVAGATLVLRPDYIALSMRDFRAFLEKERITVLNLPTPFWNEWMGDLERTNGSLPSTLRTLLVGSEMVSVDQFRQWRRLFGQQVRWCNAYGLSEATVTSTIFEPGPQTEVNQVVPIGRPMAGSEAYILDRGGHLVPPGVRGELYLGGVKNAQGYLNQPALTGQKFVQHRFASGKQARLLRTGDLARWRPDGNIEFLGRADEQVKIRGFRIELGEVESVMLHHPGVKEAVACVRPDHYGENQLLGYVVGAEPGLSGKVRAFLKTKLPAYMVPAVIVEVSEIPKTPGGKVNRKALPSPPTLRPEVDSTFAAPTDPLEQQLAQAWCGVLGLQNVGVHDNFFDLGGHSLLAVRLAAEIEKITGRNLPLFHLFQSPTVSQLGQIIRAQPSTSGSSSLLPIRAGSRKPALCLVHGAGGGMLWGYANLAKYLPEDQPVFAFNSRGMDGKSEPGTIEELAAGYVKDLLVHQPQGPYYLGGYCFGGEIAFEMARQLTALNHKVELLALFNAMPPNSSFNNLRFTPLCMARFVWNTVLWFEYFRRWTPDQRRQFVARKIKLLKKGFTYLAKRSKPQVADIEAQDWIDVSDYPDYQKRLWNVHLRASASYKPRPYFGHITVFRTRIHPFVCSFDPAFGWGEFAKGGVTVKIVPGTHESILDEPYVRTMAAELNECLQRQQQ